VTETKLTCERRGEGGSREHRVGNMSNANQLWPCAFGSLVSVTIVAIWLVMMRLVIFTIPLKFLCYYCVCHIKLILSFSKALENLIARITRTKKWLRRGYNVILVSPRLSLRIVRSNVRKVKCIDSPLTCKGVSI
jgi:hypothetical protein